MSFTWTPAQRRARAYQTLFGAGVAPESKAVLADLKKFSRWPNPPVVHDPTGRTDAMETGRLIGRQEMFNRIQSFLNLDDETLFNLREETASDE